MEPLTFWLIVLNIFLLAGVLVFSFVLSRRRSKWQMVADVKAQPVPRESLSETNRPMNGLLVRSSRDLDRLDSSIGTLQTDLDSRRNHSTLSRDVADLRRSFDAFSADMRNELNLVRAQMREKSDAESWSERAVVRNKPRKKKK